MGIKRVCYEVSTFFQVNLHTYTIFFLSFRIKYIQLRLHFVLINLLIHLFSLHIFPPRHENHCKCMRACVIEWVSVRVCVYLYFRKCQHKTNITTRSSLIEWKYEKIRIINCTNEQFGLKITLFSCGYCCCCYYCKNEDFVYEH